MPRWIILSTGYLLLTFPGGFAQLPADFTGQIVPDEYIFQPEWNRGRVNTWWRSHNAR